MRWPRMSWRCARLASIRSLSCLSPRKRGRSVRRWRNLVPRSGPKSNEKLAREEASMSFALHRPSTIAEAVALAGKYGSAARLVAGGTDLVIQINRKRLAPEHLIDLTGLPDLAGIEEDASGFVLGALTTHKTIEQHPAFQGEL